MADREDETITGDMQDSIDESFRLIAIGDAILCEAETNPAFHDWLAAFLDRRLPDNGRYLFDFLPERSGKNILPFPAVPPDTE